MEDMGEGLRTPGSGDAGRRESCANPGDERLFPAAVQQMHDEGKLAEALCNYDGPRGKTTYWHRCSTLLREQLGWEIAPENIALTNGSQSAFFYLFNLYAGRRADGR